MNLFEQAEFRWVWEDEAADGRADAPQSSQYRRALEDFARDTARVLSIRRWVRRWLNTDNERIP